VSAGKEELFLSTKLMVELVIVGFVVADIAVTAEVQFVAGN